MSGITLVDLEIEHLKNRMKYLSNIEYYLKKIKEVCRRFDSNCRLMVFGSYARNRMDVESDVDLLLITDNALDPLWRGKLFAAIGREIGLVTPFEIHIITAEEYENWYRKFIDASIEV